ncbi:MarR family winged helix-turn-helix transcriptional regulator [Sphingomonas canadensis]|uniref:MarR family winged helix-turn-helix transcriptional regulator n=1 Tax=Sphingomonas canadensis TaxID=1219257 RepID=A0ABW3HAW8_9SPHN|nr:MarR family winged helix-turn-helix transcriptional regulator [Sphingomonas canadensis]MCW3837644.1 MarR family winged helix-turn-helix transcriptional regulator [Sphingomonas canadensis]
MSLPPTWDLFGEDHLPHRLQLLAKMIDRETSGQLMREFSMSLAEWRVLAFICAAGPSSAADVGAASAIDKAEVSRATAKLVADGLIERNADPAHRRRMILAPTPLGSETHQRIRDRRRAFFQHILRDVSAESREEINRALRRIALSLVAARDQ